MNHVSKSNWRVGHANIKTSDGLYVEMLDIWKIPLNPIPKDVFLGLITLNVKGK